MSNEKNTHAALIQTIISRAPGNLFVRFSLRRVSWSGLAFGAHLFLVEPRNVDQGPYMAECWFDFEMRPSTDMNPQRVPDPKLLYRGDIDPGMAVSAVFQRWIDSTKNAPRYRTWLSEDYFIGVAQAFAVNDGDSSACYRTLPSASPHWMWHMAALQLALEALYEKKLMAAKTSADQRDLRAYEILVKRYRAFAMQNRLALDTLI